VEGVRESRLSAEAFLESVEILETFGVWVSAGRGDDLLGADCSVGQGESHGVRSPGWYHQRALPAGGE
jgi:hypothetical protein